MKLMLVLGNDTTHNIIERYLTSFGFDMVRYTHILKAMDNIDEIDPHAIIISAQDFPRHWKTMVQFIRKERSKDRCPIIILKGDNFDMEEASKASYLKVSGIVNEHIKTITEIDQIHEIISRYIYVPAKEKRSRRRFSTETWQRFGFVCIRPDTQTLVTGTVKEISSSGISFLPDNVASFQTMPVQRELTECSLRTGDSILSPVCRAVHTDNLTLLTFLYFPQGEQETLDTYLEHLPLFDLENIKKLRLSAQG